MVTCNHAIKLRIVQKENAELRAELERVKAEQLKVLEVWSNREMLARCLKAEADNAALARALEAVVRCECTFSLDPLEHARNAVQHCRDIALEVLASPNPGAKILAVVKAAREETETEKHTYPEGQDVIDARRKRREAIRVLDERSKP